MRGAISQLSGLICEIVIHLVREILHLSGKRQGKVREFQKPLVVGSHDTLWGGT